MAGNQQSLVSHGPLSQKFWPECYRTVLSGLSGSIGYPAPLNKSASKTLESMECYDFSTLGEKQRQQHISYVKLRNINYSAWNQ